MGEGDSEFEELFDAEFPAVVRSVFVVCQDLGRAEDLAQEAFLALLRHWPRVSKYDRPGAWVARCNPQGGTGDQTRGAAPMVRTPCGNGWRRCSFAAGHAG